MVTNGIGASCQNYVVPFVLHPAKVGVLALLLSTALVAAPPSKGAWLGIQLVPIVGFEDRQSVRAIRIDGPAHRAGLKTNDVILRINGQVADGGRLPAVLQAASAGQVIIFNILRGARPLTIATTAAAPLPHVETPPQEVQRKGWFGVVLETASVEEQERLGRALPTPKITRVFKGSPAEVSGIKAGEFVLTLNNKEVRGVSDLVTRIGAMKPGSEIEIKCHDGVAIIERKAVLDLRPDLRELFVNEWRGKPMPDVDVLGIDGQRRSLGAQSTRGSILVIDYFATWCGPCKQIMPRLSELQRQYQKQGVRVLGISGEELGTVEKYWKTNRPGYSLAVDDTGTFRKALNVSVLPTVWVVDHDGIIQDIWFGAGLVDKLQRRVKQLVEVRSKK